MEINYLIFAPAWSLLTLAPLILFSLSKFSHLAEQRMIKWALLAIEGMTMLFWLSGFVSLGVFLSGRICFGMVCITSLLSGYTALQVQKYPENNRLIVNSRSVM